SKRSGPAGTSSASATLRSGIAPRSTNRWSATGATSRHGPRPAGRKRQARRNIWPRRSSPPTSHRRWPTTGARSWRPSWPGESPRAAWPPISDKEGTARMKSSAQVVVVGGGVVGASVLYHLTKGGWTDVVLLERKQLTAGSTWH